MRFEIGQEVWRASWEATTTHVQCPDCAGTGRIRCIFADDTEVSIVCGNCSRDYNPPTGEVPLYTREARAKLCWIKGVEIRDGKTEWHTTDSWRVQDDHVFLTEAEALEVAKGLAAAADEEDRKRVLLKEKDTRSWAWNASYHRGCIKRAQKEIEYHTAKLNVASLKAREDRAASKTAV